MARWWRDRIVNGSDIIEITSEDGLRLVAEAFGPRDGMPVLFLGGVGQTRHSWRRAADQVVAAGYRGILMDLRGHGDSSWSPDKSYRFPHFVADVNAMIEAIGEPVAIVGASLGGKVGLAVGGYHGPAAVRAVVIVDTVPKNNWNPETNSVPVPEDGYASPDEAAAILARQRGEEPKPGAGDRLRKSMRQNEAGRWFWHWDPSLMGGSHGLSTYEALDYLNGAAAQLTVPLLVAKGELSDEVTEDGVAALRELAPQLEVETIPGARHMLVGDRNDVFAACVNDFLGRHFGGGA